MKPDLPIMPQLCSITSYMNENYDFKKFGADKIAFLGLFIFSVLIANFLVSINSKIDFSKPIELAHTGLSVSIPTGKYWSNTKQWEYNEADQTFVLETSLNLGNPSNNASVTCKYYSDSRQNMVMANSIQQQIPDSNNAAVETKLIEKGNIKIHWVCINNPVTILLANAELPNNRTMTIYIFEASAISEIAEKIFNEMVESLSLNEENPVQAGADFVAEMKSRGIDSLINSSNMQSCFFRKDSANNNIGYTIDILGFSNGDDDFTIRGASDMFLSGRNPLEQKSLFSCDKGLTNFIWKSRINTRNRQMEVTMTLDESGTITVVNENSGQSIQYLNCKNVVPNILLESFIIPAIEHGISNIVIDLIDSSGSISPTLFFLKRAENSDEGYSYIVTLKSIDESDSESFYLDENNRVIKSDGNYILERTDIETIEKEFPGMTDYIKEQMRLLNPNAI